MSGTERDAAKRRGKALFARIAAEYLPHEGVDMGPMFGSEGLRVRGKVFAFIGFDGDLIIKVPADRAAEWAATSGASRMVMNGRELREWLTLPQQESATWPHAIAEAYAYLDRITP
jgi:hypothetical protein